MVQDIEELLQKNKYKRICPDMDIGCLDMINSMGLLLPGLSGQDNGNLLSS